MPWSHFPLYVVKALGREYLCLQERRDKQLQKWNHHCLSQDNVLPAEMKNKPSPDTLSQKEALLFLPHPCNFYRTRHFSHFWGFDDSSPNVRLHASSRDPHPTVMQTWSCSLSYTNNRGGIWRPPVAPEAVWLTPALWDSFPHSSPTGRSMNVMPCFVLLTRYHGQRKLWSALMHETEYEKACDALLLLQTVI